MNITGKLICVTVLVFHVSFAFGQALPVVNIDTDPKTVSIGFADIVSDNMESAVFGNPAAMSFSDFKVAAAGSYCYWQPDAIKEHRSFLSGSYKVNDRWAVAAGLANGVGCSYDMYGKDAEFIGKFTPLNLHFKVGASCKLLPYLSFGMNVGFVDNIMAPEYANMAFLADLFVMSSVHDFKIVVGARNLGVAWTDSGTMLDNLPFAVSAGASYGKSFHDSHGVGVYAQYDFMGADAMSTSLGASYSYRNIISLRTGGRIGFGKVPSMMSVGCGVTLKPVEFNLAYILPVQGTALSNTVCISIVYMI